MRKIRYRASFREKQHIKIKNRIKPKQQLKILKINSGQPFGISSAIFAIPASVLLLYFVSKATYKEPTERDIKFFEEQGEQA